MKHKLLLVAALATMVFSSCSVTTRVMQSSPVMARNVELDPIKADIEVNEDTKLSGTGIVKYVFGIRVGNSHQKTVEGITYSEGRGFSLGNLLDRGKSFARSVAAYDALKACPDCDVLVHPKYEITVRKSPLGFLFKTYTVRVTGYGAKYKNFRTEKELKLIGSDSKEYIIYEEGR